MKTIQLVIFVGFLVAVCYSQCPDQDGTLSNWSTLFGSATDVTILASQRVKLNTNVQINSLTINGTLVFDDSKNINVTAHWIKINPGGVMKIGSQSCPYTHKVIVTFTGSYSTANDMGSDPSGGGLGTKGLAVTSGGSLEVFGSVPSITWTRITAVASAGSTSLTVEDAVSWPVGAQIAIASTDYSTAGEGLVPDQSEQNEIASISGNTITLKNPLTYMHWADKAGYERAEVGLLTRNIVFQGDASSDNGGFGGHLIFRKVQYVQIQGAEFYRMGQLGILGRYPIHFHLLKDQTSKNFTASYNAIHRSYQRCVTIHDSMGIKVAHNVAFNATGHCYFLEDGPERLNIFDHNLGMRINNGSLLSSDVDPAVFWITNPNNTVINNAAVGGAFGYWYSLPMHPVSTSEADYSSDLWVWPRYTPLGTFDNNVGHSHSRNGLMVDEMLEPDETTPLNSYTPRQGPFNYTLPESWQYAEVIAVFTNFVGYKNREHGVWTRGGPIHVKNVVLLDNTNAILLVPGPTLVENALIVGESDNIGTEFSYWGMETMGRSRPVYWTNNYPITGWSTYDNGGPQFARNITFRNFTTNSFRGAGAVTVLPNGPFMLWATDKLEDLKFDNANEVYLENWPNAYDSSQENDGPNGVNIIDNDGSITGEYGNWIVSDTAFMLNSDCEEKTSWNAWICPKTLEGYTQLRIETPTYPSTSGHYKASFHLLGDSAHPFINVTGGGESDYIYTANVVPFRGYTVRWGSATPSNLQVSLGGSTTKEWVIMALPYPSGTTFTITTDYDYAPVTPVNTLAELVSKYNYFWDSTNKHLYLFVQSVQETHGEIWDFSYHSSYNSFVDVTAYCPGSCVVGTPSFGTSSPSPALPPAPANNLVYFKATLGGCFASPAIDSDYEGVAFGAYDPSTALFTYNIYHTAKEQSSRVYLGSGSKKAAGTEYMQLVGSKSSIKGSITLSQQKINDLWAGRLFVALESSEHPDGELRGFFGCDESSSSDCSVNLETTDPSSFCSLPASDLVLYSDDSLEANWDDWTWGDAVIQSLQVTDDFVCGTSSMKVYFPGNGQSGSFLLGYYPSTTIDTSTYKYLSFFVKAVGSFVEETNLYVQISPNENTYFDAVLVTKDHLSGFAIDNAGWSQVLISVDELGFGTGVQDLRVVGIYTPYWMAQPVTLLIDELKFVEDYSRMTTDAVTESPHMYNEKEECDGSKVGSANSISFVGMLIFGLILLVL